VPYVKVLNGSMPVTFSHDRLLICRATDAALLHRYEPSIAAPGHRLDRTIQMAGCAVGLLRSGLTGVGSARNARAGESPGRAYSTTLEAYDV